MKQNHEMKCDEMEWNGITYVLVFKLVKKEWNGAETSGMHFISFNQFPSFFVYSIWVGWQNCSIILWNTHTMKKHVCYCSIPHRSTPFDCFYNIQT